MEEEEEEGTEAGSGRGRGRQKYDEINWEAEENTDGRMT